MKLIVLCGLVSVEKSDLTIELVQYFTNQQQSVAVIDNIHRMAIQPPRLAEAVHIRLQGNIRHYLTQTLEHIQTEIAIAAVSAAADPNDLFLLLEEVRQHLPQVTIRTIALLDDRTKNCFPETSETLEHNADLAVSVPVGLEDVKAVLAWE